MGIMHANMTIAPTISEPLTWTQICERYPDEWVCLVEIEWLHPRNFEFRTARVVGHGKTRRAPFEQARPWREHYNTMGHFHTHQYVPEYAEPECKVGLADDSLPVLSAPRIDEGARRNVP
jgi:hypothetical protein